MRHFFLIPMCLAGGLTLAGCTEKADETVERAFQDVNVVDEHDLNDVMLTVADPNEAVSYFQRAVKSTPDRIDLQRGLAKSLVRARRVTEGVSAWGKLVKMEGATPDDMVDLADAQIRNGNWDKAKKTLDSVPPTHESFKRYRLEAMVADANSDWSRADTFYETAVGLTTRPAGVMNNWGYSKLTRGDFTDAERLFGEAIRQDTTLFTAKNNLVLARGAQRKYTLPVIPMSQVERAQLLHTMALSAIKQGDVETGKGLLREAVTTHPQHFEEAVRSLRALEKA
ncbi:MAG: tetratricopeptide repeat protein [Rhodobacteraceae bacterium]|nr:tetratricopeptide repeat protein [Paracoccaceae bacterium]